MGSGIISLLMPFSFCLLPYLILWYKNKAQVFILCFLGVLERWRCVIMNELTSENLPSTFDDGDAYDLLADGIKYGRDFYIALARAANPSAGGGASLG